jgi:hypothetical protein
MTHKCSKLPSYEQNRVPSGLRVQVLPRPPHRDKCGSPCQSTGVMSVDMAIPVRPAVAEMFKV